MSWTLPEHPSLNAEFCEVMDRYRQAYLGYFLGYYELHYRPGYRGGFFDINSITGAPFGHGNCYSWTDGRSLAELAICYLHGLGDTARVRTYVEHLCDALVERYDLNGCVPHSVDADTNLSADDPLNVPIADSQSSYSHLFVLNGLLHYDMVFGDRRASELADLMLSDTVIALREDDFLESAAPRPGGQRAHGPFMITVGVCADVLETMTALWASDSKRLEQRSQEFIDLGAECVDYILENHYRPDDDAFWEVSQSGGGVPDEDGRVITDPGHSIEFTGFAARLARFLPGPRGAELTDTCRRIFSWAASVGFHPTKDLIYKNVDRDTHQPVMDSRVGDISRLVDEGTLHEHFSGAAGPVRMATFPWWVPMELLAAGSLLRVPGDTGPIDEFMIRAARGIFEHFSNARIGGLCYQSIGDGFFGPVDIAPATPSLDLMHSHRSLRVMLRELRAQLA